MTPEFVNVVKEELYNPERCRETFNLISKQLQEKLRKRQLLFERSEEYLVRLQAGGVVRGGASEDGVSKPFKVEGGVSKVNGVGETSGIGEPSGVSEMMVSGTPEMEDHISKTPKIEGGVSDTPKIEGGVREIPKIEGGVSNTPKIEGGVGETPKIESGVSETPKIEGGVSKTPKIESGVSKTPKFEGGVSEMPEVNEAPKLEGEVSQIQSAGVCSSSGEVSHISGSVTDEEQVKLRVCEKRKVRDVCNWVSSHGISPSFAG